MVRLVLTKHIRFAKKGYILHLLDLRIVFEEC